MWMLLPPNLAFLFLLFNHLEKLSLRFFQHFFKNCSKKLKKSKINKKVKCAIIFNIIDFKKSAVLKLST